MLLHSTLTLQTCLQKRVYRMCCLEIDCCLCYGGESMILERDLIKPLAKIGIRITFTIRDCLHEKLPWPLIWPGLSSFKSCNELLLTLHSALPIV